MIKIAFSGKCTSGKTTAALITKGILSQHGHPSEVVSFAGKIKELAKELFGMTTKDRELLQDLGQKMRDINKDVWLDYAIKRSNELDCCIIDDLRFKNELNTLVQEGFIIIRLNVNKETQIQRLTKLYPYSWQEQVARLGHNTEIDLDEHEFKNVINVSNLSDLKSNIESILLKYKVFE